jgi:hypothetical protein
MPVDSHQHGYRLANARRSLFVVVVVATTSCPRAERHIV